MKRFSAILLVAVTALALIGSPGIKPLSGCHAVEGWDTGNWCVK